MTAEVDGRVTSPDGTRIAWTRLGSGPSLVMVPGVMASRARPQQQGLADALAAHWTVWTYDRRGTGASGSVGGADYHVEQEFDDLAAMLEQAGADALVYGFSSGATLALLAARHGLPIARLVLVEPPILADSDDARLAEARRRLETDLAAARRWFDVEVTGIPEEVMAQFPPYSEADLANTPTMLHELTFLPGNPAGSFRDVHVPALVLASDHTAPFLLACARDLADALPHVTLQIRPGQWHGIDADDIVAQVTQFDPRVHGVEHEVRS